MNQEILDKKWLIKVKIASSADRKRVVRSRHQCSVGQNKRFSDQWIYCRNEEKISSKKNRRIIYNFSSNVLITNIRILRRIRIMVTISNILTRLYRVISMKIPVRWVRHSFFIIMIMEMFVNKNKRKRQSKKYESEI